MTEPPPTISDEQAMWRVQNEDDHSAFGRLLVRWEGPIRRLCLRMLADAHRAEDLTQETFARVFAKRRQFDPGSRFSTWLWRIAINLCHDELRRRARRPEASLPDSDSECGFLEPATEHASPDESLARTENAQAVRRALAALAEPYRSVVVLRHYEGLKFTEIAEVLGVPEGTVKSRMAEGLNRLGQSLRDLQIPAAGNSPNPATHRPANLPSLSRLLPRLSP